MNDVNVTVTACNIIMVCRCVSFHSACETLLTLVMIFKKRQNVRLLKLMSLSDLYFVNMNRSFVNTTDFQSFLQLILWRFETSCTKFQSKESMSKHDRNFIDQKALWCKFNQDFVEIRVEIFEYWTEKIFIYLSL